MPLGVECGVVFTKSMQQLNTTKPKILIALFRLPYPATDGTRYKILHNLVSGLKKDFDVEFFVVHIKGYSLTDVEHMEREFGKVHLFHHSKIAYGINSLPALVNGLPLQAQAFHFGDAQRWLDAHIDGYAAVYIHEIRMTEFFINYSTEQKQRFLVDFNDAISMNYETGLAHMILPLRWFYRWEGKRVAQYESMVLKSFAHFSIVSERDRDYLIDRAGLRSTYDGGTVDFSVIHHGAPMHDAVASRSKRQLFFIGSLDYGPNRNALDWLLGTLWPEVLKRMPDVELLVVGGGLVNPTWKMTPQVTLTGFVSDVFTAVESARALVAPIAFAGGTPSKIIEAMGYGIPVVTTKEGAAGITGAVNGVHALMLPKYETEVWVQTLVNLLADETQQESLAQSGRELVLQHYSQRSAEAAFHNRFSEIINKKIAS